MKLIYPALVFASLITWTDAAEESGPREPQPRPRLPQELTVTPAATEKSAPAAADDTVLMEKIVVTDTKVPAQPRRMRRPEPTSFSLADGGPIIRKQLGARTLEIGLWTPTDVFEENADYKAVKTHVELDVVRVKW